MMTTDDLKRLHLPKLTNDQIRRVSNAEKACRDSQTNWGKNYWFEVLRKLCSKYNCMDYFRKIAH